mmetsp:Transcript_12492/g.39478  ORF Transcript_12492/g.39478 Transcript_12492/m.39478 type:complete len:444 (+) Transcript_12492:78-1409(+)
MFFIFFLFIHGLSAISLCFTPGLTCTSDLPPQALACATTLRLVTSETGKRMVEERNSGPSDDDGVVERVRQPAPVQVREGAVKRQGIEDGPSAGKANVWPVGEALDVTQSWVVLFPQSAAAAGAVVHLKGTFGANVLSWSAGNTTDAVPLKGVLQIFESSDTAHRLLHCNFTIVSSAIDKDTGDAMVVEASTTLVQSSDTNCDRGDGTVADPVNGTAHATVSDMLPTPRPSPAGTSVPLASATATPRPSPAPPTLYDAGLAHERNASVADSVTDDGFGAVEAAAVGATVVALLGCAVLAGLLSWTRKRRGARTNLQGLALSRSGPASRGRSRRGTTASRSRSRAQLRSGMDAPPATGYVPMPAPGSDTYGYEVGALSPPMRQPTMSHRAKPAAVASDLPSDVRLYGQPEPVHTYGEHADVETPAPPQQQTVRAYEVGALAAPF